MCINLFLFLVISFLYNNYYLFVAVNRTQICGCYRLQKILKNFDHKYRLGALEIWAYCSLGGRYNILERAQIYRNMIANKKFLCQNFVICDGVYIFYWFIE